MKLVWDSDAALHFVTDVLKPPREFGPAQGAVVVNGNKPIAGWLFHDWYPESKTLEVTAAASGPNWGGRGVLRELMQYAFGDAGAQALVCRTDPGNVPVRKWGKALGAKEHILPRLRGRGRAECVLILTDDAWKASKYAHPPLPVTA